jgi:hypothetical protein
LDSPGPTGGEVDGDAETKGLGFQHGLVRRSRVMPTPSSSRTENRTLRYSDRYQR